MKNPHRTGQGAARAQATNTQRSISAPPSAGQPVIDAHRVVRTRAQLAFGPWAPGLDPVERAAQLRCIAGLAALFVGSAHPLVAALQAAERDPEAAAQAFAMLDALPTLTRRRVLSAFGAVTWPAARRERSRERASHGGVP
jgi:hypothetical protein